MNKRLFALICAVCLLSVMLGGYAFAEETTAESDALPGESGTIPLLGRVDGEVIYTDIPIYVSGERMGFGYKVGAVTYVSLREFCDAIGLENSTSWDQKTCTVRVRTDGLDLAVVVGSNYMTANGRCFYLQNGVHNLNGVVIMPIRDLARCFGLDVTWNASDWSAEVVVDKITYLEQGDKYYNEDDLYWLSRIIYSEAGNQGLDGMIGVGNVVLNRVEAPSCPDTIYDVIFDDRYGVQFHPTENGAIYEEPNELSVVAAKICLEGYELVGDSLFFVNPEIGVTGWFASTRTYVATIGDHAFYA